MRVWLKQLRVTEIVMESTGVYWRPLWQVLQEQGFRLVLANPAHVKALHGRKSDRRDAQRIAEFLQDNRLRGSFVPSAEMQQLRLLLRQRISLVEQRNEVHNQIRDLFETAGVKLSSVLSDLLGLTGRNIIEALIHGETSAEKLSWKVRGSLRKKEKEVKESLKGCFSDFHRDVLQSLYEHYRFLSGQIEHFEKLISQRMEPHADKVERLDGIPGVDRLVAWHLIAELGTDMTVLKMPIVVRLGRVWCRARTKARARTTTPAAARATVLCGASLPKRPGPPRVAKRAICVPSSTALRRAPRLG